MIICTTETFFASFVTPMEEMSAVAQVPMFAPRTSGIATLKLICPVAARVCTIPMVAAEDWITPVNTVEASTATRGFSKTNRS